MQSTLLYPTLRLQMLTSLVQMKGEFERNPDLFKADACPYDEDTVKLLEKLFAATVIEKIVEKKVAVPENGGKRGPKERTLSVDDQNTVETELRSLLETLKSMETGDDLDTSAKLQIVKTKASLIEQLLKGLERVYNVKRVSNFQAVVISILDDLVDEDGREIFLQRVEPYRDE